MALASGLRRSNSVLDHLRQPKGIDHPLLRRRLSHDVLSDGSECVQLLIDVDDVVEELLKHDLDGDKKLAVKDDATHSIRVPTASSYGFRRTEVSGVYRLWNLLEQAASAKEQKSRVVLVDGAALSPEPVKRLTHLIDERFWPNLTRHLDETALESALVDDKNTKNPIRRIYVPRTAMEQYHYYQAVSQRRPNLNLEVNLLPSVMTHDLYRQMNGRPGILALDMESMPNYTNDKLSFRGLPYVVPGGRFNELYNWDSYFIALGLLRSGQCDLVEGLIKNFIFEIQHYGLIPNANRSYYILRSQPPFLTNLAVEWYKLVVDARPQQARQLLIAAIAASIKEYHKVWMSEPRFDGETSLSRFRPDGIASPPECQTSHFRVILKPFAEKHGLSVQDFREKYDAGLISEPELDTYFLHDRAVRESGHDVSSRTEHVCADLAIVDLNSLLYKYETDIADVISNNLKDEKFSIPTGYRFDGQDVERDQTAQTWLDRAAARKTAMDRYLWDSNTGCYRDYNTSSQDAGKVEGVTCLWPLWSRIASKEQAASLVPRALQLFECAGGLSGTPEDRHGDKGSLKWQVEHQWDYPFGWAPHQVMAWDGLLNYGFRNDAQRVAYKWLLVVLKTFVEQNGCVVEKYNVTTLLNSQVVDADYGNQGIDFEYYPKEGFGWTNASFVYGLDILSEKQRKALSLLAPWSDSLL